MAPRAVRVDAANANIVANTTAVTNTNNVGDLPATVNGIIDDLRRGEVGIVEIARPRRTLEEAFLEVVAEDRN